MKKRIALAIILSLIISASPFQVNAAVEPSVVNSCASALAKLGLLTKDSKGDLRTQTKMKRCEFISLVFRMFDYSIEPGMSKDVPDFADVPKKHWAYGYMKSAAVMGLISPSSDNTLKPERFITLAEAEEILIRALGYGDTLSGEFPGNITAKSKELRLDSNLDLPPDKELTRGEVSVLVFNSLTVSFKTK